MDDELDIDVADAAGIDEDAAEPSTGADGDELRGDIEEAIAKQQIDKGHPEPYRGLKGRTDDQPGGHYEGLGEYAKQAAKSGTTLKQAVADYWNVEQSIRRDPVSGLRYACRRLGLDPVGLAQRILQQAQPQTQAQQYQAAQYQQQSYQQQSAHQAEYQHHVADIETSRRTLPFFDNLRPAMAKIALDPRVRSVKQAYDIALKINPTFGMSAEIARRDAIRDKQMGRGKRR